MTNTFMSFALLLTFSAKSCAENVGEIPSNIPSDKLTSFNAPFGINQIELVNLLGRPHPSEDSGKVCVHGDDHFFPSDFKHCFGDDDLSNITTTLIGLAVDRTHFRASGRSYSHFVNVTALKTLSQRNRMFSTTDYLLVWKCIQDFIHPRLHEDYKGVIQNLLASAYANYSLHFVLNHFLHHSLSFQDNFNFTIVNSDLVLSVWHPFQTNITGVALYQKYDAGSYWIRPIYIDETADDVEMEDLKVAGYVPHEFLETFPDKNQQQIVLVMVMNGKKYNQILEIEEGIENYVGISVPGFCKTNRKPVLKAFFRSHTDGDKKEWIEFGREYFDSLQRYSWYSCALTRMSYFGRFPAQSPVMKRAKVHQSCLTPKVDPPITAFFKPVDGLLYNVSNEIDEIIENETRRFYDRAFKIVEPDNLEEVAENDPKRWRRFLLELRSTAQLSDVVADYRNDNIRGASREETVKILGVVHQRTKFMYNYLARCGINLYVKRYSTPQSQYFETLKDNYCMEEKVSDTLKWRQAETYQTIYPENFCLNRNLEVPHRSCFEGRIVDQDVHAIAFYKECSDDHPILNSTEYLYQLLVDCLYKTQNNVNAADLILIASNYIDIALVLRTFTCRYINGAKLYIDAIEKGLTFLEKQIKDDNHLSYITTFLQFYLNVAHPDAYEIRHNIIYISFRPWLLNITGYAFYRRGGSSFLDYEIKPIFYGSETKNYSNDEDVEIVVYATCHNCTYPLYYIGIVDLFVIRSSKFTETDDYFSKSRTVGVLNSGLLPTVQFNIYLKVTETEHIQRSGRYNNKEGHWLTANFYYLEPGRFRWRMLTLISIVEPKYNVCDSTSKFSLFYKYLDSSDYNSEDIDETKIKKAGIDFLSQLIISVNRDIQELHEEHSSVLRAITFSISILSAFGLTSILITAFYIEDWYRKRSSSIQLSIAVACETSFLLTDSQHVIHVTYVVFYYFLLAQFAWMMVIGYVQYTRFVKVFETSELGVVKPMIAGWLAPLILILALIFSNMDCLKCNLCSKNGKIFTYYVLLPVLVVIICNLVIYVMVMVNISRLQFQLSPEAQKARMRAAIMLPFMSGISWISLSFIFAPWSWVSMMGSYLFHIIASSQGLIVFVFLIVLDKRTLQIWRQKLENIYNSIKSLCSE